MDLSLHRPRFFKGLSHSSETVVVESTFNQRLCRSNRPHARAKPGLTSRETQCSTDSTSKTQHVQQELRSRSHGSSSQQLTTSRLDRLWILEIAAVLVSIGCLVAIAVILAIHDNSPLSSWTFYLSLNTVVSILATASKTTILFTITAALSQGKWNSFKAQPGSLNRFQEIDRASRGGIGSFRAIWSSSVGLIVSLGACISLLSLAFEPMTQALITNHGALRNSTVGYQATIGSTNRVSGGREGPIAYGLWVSDDGNQYESMPIYTDIGVEVAILGGFQTTQQANSSTQLFWTCPTGNCTWPTYGSLAVCSKCYDVSEFIIRGERAANSTKPDVYQYQASNVMLLPDSYQNMTITNFTLSYNGLSIDNWSTYRNASVITEHMVAKTAEHPRLTAKFKDHESLLAAFSTIRANTSYLNNQSMWQDAKPSATECGLFVCLQAYNTTVRSGELIELVVADTHRKVPRPWQPLGNRTGASNQTSVGTLDWNPINKNGYIERGDFQLDPSDLNVSNADLAGPFNATQALLDSTVRYLSDIFGEKNSFSRTDDPTFGAAYEEFMTTERAYSVPIMQSFYESSDLDETFANVARSMTAYFRNTSNRTQQGFVESWVIHYRVRWGFMTLPAFVVVGGAIFLCLSIFQTQRHGMAAWKHNLIASMVFSVDADTRTQLRTALLSQKLDDVGEITVYMHDREDGVELSSKAFTEDAEDDEHGGVDAASLMSAGLTATAGDSLMSTTPENEFVEEVGLASPVQESPNLHPDDRRF